MRFFYILFLLAKYSLHYVLISLNFSRSRRSKLIKSFFEEAGGAFIKFGQILALRVDVLPKEYVLELTDLFDQVKPFPYDEVERICLSELGATPQKLFTVFEKTPFASASFAQVHAAKLHDETVVVKVQRPDVEQTVIADFLIIDVLSFIADLFFKIDALPWREFAKEFKQWTEKELDYHLEAENMQKLYETTHAQGITNVIIPQTYHRLSTKKILVQEYIDGIPLSRVLRGLRMGKLTTQNLTKIGIDIQKTPGTIIMELFRQYFIDGFFHADPHPGNILLLNDDKIGLIDFGIVGEAAPKRQVFLKFLLTGARSRYEKEQLKHVGYYAFQFAGDHIKQMVGSALAATVDEKAIDGFISLLSNHFYEYYKTIDTRLREDLKEMKIDYTTMLLQVLKFVNRYQVTLPKQFAVFMRAITIIGILGKELNNDINVSKIIIDFCKRYPPEELKTTDSYAYKRLSREKAIERLNNWMTYLVEKDPELYKLVNQYISHYTVLEK